MRYPLFSVGDGDPGKDGGNGGEAGIDIDATSRLQGMGGGGGG